MNRKQSRSMQLAVAASAAAMAGLALCRPASATSIVTWNAPSNISGPGSKAVTTTPAEGQNGTGAMINNGTNDVSTLGTQVLGVNYSGAFGASFPFNASIAGQNFVSVRNP